MVSLPTCLKPFRKQPPKIFVNQESQTVIKKKCQTELSLQLDNQETKKFYAMLEYTPYQDIQQSCLRVIPMERKSYLSTEPNSLSRLNLTNCLFLDDDALSEFCLDLRDLVRSGCHQARSFGEMGAQTDLKVRPMVLENEEVANVLSDSSTQTEMVSASRQPSNSKAIVPNL